MITPESAAADAPSASASSRLRTIDGCPKRTVSQIAIPIATGVQIPTRFSTWSKSDSCCGSALASPPATTPITAATRTPSTRIRSGRLDSGGRLSGEPGAGVACSGGEGTAGWMPVASTSSSFSRLISRPTS